MYIFIFKLLKNLIEIRIINNPAHFAGFQIQLYYSSINNAGTICPRSSDLYNNLLNKMGYNFLDILREYKHTFDEVQK